MEHELKEARQRLASTMRELKMARMAKKEDAVIARQEQELDDAKQAMAVLKDQMTNNQGGEPGQATRHDSLPTSPVSPSDTSTSMNDTLEEQFQQARLEGGQEMMKRMQQELLQARQEVANAKNDLEARKEMESKLAVEIAEMQDKLTPALDESARRGGLLDDEITSWQHDKDYIATLIRETEKRVMEFTEKTRDEPEQTDDLEESPRSHGDITYTEARLNTLQARHDEVKRFLTQRCNTLEEENAVLRKKDSLLDCGPDGHLALIVQQLEAKKAAHHAELEAKKAAHQTEMRGIEDEIEAMLAAARATRDEMLDTARRECESQWAATQQECDTSKATLSEAALCLEEARVESEAMIEVTQEECECERNTTKEECASLKETLSKAALSAAEAHEAMLEAAQAERDAILKAAQQESRHQREATQNECASLKAALSTAALKATTASAAISKFSRAENGLTDLKQRIRSKQELNQNLHRSWGSGGDSIANLLERQCSAADERGRLAAAATEAAARQVAQQAEAAEAASPKASQMQHDELRDVDSYIEASCGPLDDVAVQVLLEIIIHYPTAPFLIRGVCLQRRAQRMALRSPKKDMLADWRRLDSAKSNMERARQ
jgi:hypothetical protein